MSLTINKALTLLLLPYKDLRWLSIPQSLLLSTYSYMHAG